MLLYAFVSLFITGITEAFNDKPMANFTWQLDRVKGACYKPEPLFYSDNKEDYEGRWYGLHASYKEKQMKTLSCTHWDTFYDKEVQHDIFYMSIYGIPQQVAIKEDPIGTTKGVFLNDVGPDPKFKNIYTILYYVDSVFQVRYYIQCFDDGTVSRDAEVGYRKVSSANDKPTEEKMASILDKLKAEVGEINVKKVNHHEHCAYQPEVKVHPYKH